MGDYWAIKDVLVWMMDCGHYFRRLLIGWLVADRLGLANTELLYLK